MTARRFGSWCAVSAAMVLGSSTAGAAPGEHDHLLPEVWADGAARARWATGDGWRLAPAQALPDGGTRVAAMIIVHGADGAPLALEARGVDGAARGPWRPLTETWRGGEQRVAIAELDRAWPAAELRLPAGDDARVATLGWELVRPRYPDAGRLARTTAVAAAAELPPELVHIGVIARATWGARATTCTAAENDWYRMAIHHTAGPETSGGAIVNVVRGLQAYAQDSGTYCDIPYQFLVGRDGSLYEARPYGLVSGATGGGNNDGNSAVCFMGCYHPTGCPSGVASVDVNPANIAAGRLMVQTLGRLHDIPRTEAAIKGHRDWPGNSTACPGDRLHARLGDLRAEQTWYQAGVISAPPAIPYRGVGVPIDVTVEVRNDGSLPWNPGETFLAPVPRDVASDLDSADWAAPTRIVSPTAPVAPGETWTATFALTPKAPIEYRLALGLLTEGVTWFADPPWGGGPVDGAIAITLTPMGDVDTDGGVESGGAAGGCCQTGGDGRWSTALAVMLVGLALVRRRR